MLYNLSKNEVDLIINGLMDKPWIEVRDLLDKLIGVKAKSTESPYAASTPTADAPYGLKKDGTPRARPGRKPSKRKARK